MKVLLYSGGRQLVKESGVGRALSHQEQALSYGNVDFTENTKDDYDIVHINTVLPDAWAMAVKAQKEGKKVVYHGHSTREDFRNSFIGSNTFAPLFGRWLCSCYGKADLVLTPSEYSRKLLTGYGLKVPVAAVSNGIDIDFFQKEEGQRRRFRQKHRCREDEKIVLTVGLPIERKGILDFLKLAEQMPQYRFFWCGHAAEGLIPGKIRKAMKEAPENVRFLGYLNREQLRDAFTVEAICFLSHKRRNRRHCDAGGPCYGDSGAGKRHSRVSGLAGKRSSGVERKRPKGICQKDSGNSGRKSRRSDEERAKNGRRTQP